MREKDYGANDVFFLCCLGAGVSFIGSYSFLFFPWEEGENERGEDTRGKDTRGMWKLEQREVCSVPRADARFHRRRSRLVLCHRSVITYEQLSY